VVITKGGREKRVGQLQGGNQVLLHKKRKKRPREEPLWGGLENGKRTPTGGKQAKRLGKKTGRRGGDLKGARLGETYANRERRDEKKGREKEYCNAS